MPTYFHELPDWPNFLWNQDLLASLLANVRHRQGRLIGRMEGIGLPLRQEAMLETLTQDVLKSSEIEGDILEHDQVRSSIAQRLGLDIGGLKPIDRHVEGIVEMMLDATRGFDQPLTQERLFSWHTAIFPTNQIGLMKISVGAWRSDASGPMQVVSGPIGREKIHYQAPSAARVDAEMHAFINWFEAETNIDPVLKAGLSHLWFVSIHPFDDGNGRMARAIADMALARSEQCALRFYSMSNQIRQERQAYYNALEQVQKGSLEVTFWLQWFLACMSRAIDNAESTLAVVLKKASFWNTQADKPLNDRQRLILNRLLDGFEGKLNTSKWAKIAKCSQDTAYRDILNLVELGLLIKSAEGGRSTCYLLALPE